jgi:tetratricopeptide (TPR) repeat protein
LLGNIEKTTRGWTSSEAKAEYDRALELLEHVEDPPLQSSVSLGLWGFYLVRGDLRVALEVGKQILRLAEKTADRDIEAAGRMAIANVAFWLGDLRETCAQAEAIERIYDAEAFREHRTRYGQDLYVVVQMMRCWALWLQGRPEGALQVAKENVERAERLDHPFSMAIALTALAWQHLHLRDPDATLAVAERLIQLSRERTFPSYAGLGVMLRGWAIARDEHAAEGAALIEQGFAAWSSDSPGLTNTFFAMLAAEAYLRAGRRADALAVLGRGLDAVRDHDERPYGPELLRLKGECLAVGGPAERTEAIDSLRRALAEAAALGAPMLSLRAAVSLGHHARSAEDRAEARQALATALQHVTEGPALPDLLDAQRALAALETPDPPHKGDIPCAG